MIIAAILICIGTIYAGDTGTYEILDYRVKLTPSSTGAVKIEYYQKWKVTGGHIPWITVGTAGGDYRIEKYGGAAVSASDASQGNWSGVRLDLDKDYRAGDIFEVSFVLQQNKLFYADNENYGLEFTPGWYDRAIIDTLSISVIFFANISTVTAKPKPSAVADNVMTWMKVNLSRGEKLSISISFPKKLFPAEINKSKLKSEGGSAGYIPLIMLVFAFILFIVLKALVSSKRRKYSGGNIFYGGIFGGRGGKGSGGSGRSTGGGGGFGGGGFSCACACVSCACACACAGGGGAGCGRKDRHSCPVCKATEKK